MDLRIGYTDVILQNLGDGKGKIIISDDEFGYNFSNYWGAMGEGNTLIKFLCEINSPYFVDKLSTRTNGDFDSKKTFTNVRKMIREEFPWYFEPEFQKDLREKINQWESECYDERYFVDSWQHFFKYTVDYYIIEDVHHFSEVEGYLQGVCEHWNYIALKEPRENIWLKKFHGKLKKELQPLCNHPGLNTYEWV
jgi:hypothetical protein